MGTLKIEWESLDNLFEAMVLVGGQAEEVDTYFSQYVCDTAGFDYDKCVLRPIGDQVGKLDGIFTDMRKVFDKHWEGTAATVVATAKSLDEVDHSLSINYDKYLGELSPTAAALAPDVNVDIETFDVDPLDLPAPGPGADTFPHDTEWDAISGGYDACRDTINSGISKINSLGVVHVPSLSEKSLEDYIVFPLSGNYLKIQGNAAACDTTGAAMTSWAGNFVTFAAKSELAMEGQAGSALMLHLGVYGAVMAAVGKCIDAGSAVFSVIADTSEKIADKVERALVRMGKLLLKVSTKIAARVLSWFGWTMLAAEIVEKGFDAITDIYDDVMACIDIITMCFDLVEVIRAWAEEAAAELKKFEELSEVIQQLPGSSPGGLEQLPPVNIDIVEGQLSDITYGDEDAAGPTDELGGALDDLDENSEEAGQGSGDDDEGDVLMAPGPLEVPYQGPGGSSTGTTTYTA